MGTHVRSKHLFYKSHIEVQQSNANPEKLCNAGLEQALYFIRNLESPSFPKWLFSSGDQTRSIITNTCYVEVEYFLRLQK